jgi:geranylgeranyl pyrophosphate synthase
LLARFLQESAAAVEAEIGRRLGSASGHAAPRLIGAMRYAALGGGKRLRAALVRAVAQTLGHGGDGTAWLATAAGIEAVHAYSLIHDDLPAMDDATTRRGRAACHLAFDEATAILAGDALQAAAFEWIAEDEHLSIQARLALVAGLARAAGAAGMCGGQMLDLQGEVEPPDLDGLELMERLKTGAMIAFAAEAGALVAGSSPEIRHGIVQWARCLGLAFQIKDDLLDVEGDSRVTGKDPGLDAERGKTTFVSLMGVDSARQRIDLLGREANRHLRDHDIEVDLLDSLFHYVVTRDR